MFHNKTNFEKAYGALADHPPRSSAHWIYTLLFLLGTISVMWQHCDPGLTLSVLCLIPAFSMTAYIPYRYFGLFSRFLIRTVTVSATLGWAFYRFKSDVPFDKVGVECVVLTTLCFLMGSRPRDYNYLFAASVFLLMYGALLPRTVFLIVFALSMLFLVLLLYGIRLKNLGSDFALTAPAGVFRRNWPAFLIHFLLAAGLFWLMIGAMPNSPNRSKGLFDVSFFTEKDNMLPPDVKQWLLPAKKVAASPRGREHHKNGSLELSNAGVPLTTHGKNNKISGNGSGGSQGTDLVFQVKSPVKLYHLMALYDEYDGRQWRTSKYLSKPGSNLKKHYDSARNYCDTDFIYTVRKWITRKLPAPYRPVSYSASNSGGGFLYVQSTFYNAALPDRDYPVLPFEYRVTAHLEIPDAETEKNIWYERVSPNHYRKLPHKKIAKRIRQLAERTVGDRDKPYDKAIALRDYLRTHYSYELNAARTPENRESADYFLFDLKKGHCEYFAVALTVLARCAGLPARVATGFSPGNYNALSNVFEIYEYHAHAWSQIYIDGMGWLTFDATPPGAIISETTPLGIGKLRDPFGDEWRVSPPELTSSTLEYIRNSILEREMEQNGENSGSFQNALLTVVNAEEKIRENIKTKYDSSNGKMKKNASASKGKLSMAAINRFFADFPNWISGKFQILTRFVSRNRSFFPPLLLVLLSSFLMIKMILFHLARRGHLKRTLEYFRKACGVRKDSPSESIHFSYLAIRSALELAGYPRVNNQELMEYAESIRSFDDDCYENAVSVFRLFYQMEYAGLIPTPLMADKSLSETTLLCRTVCLKLRIRGGAGLFSSEK